MAPVGPRKPPEAPACGPRRAWPSGSRCVSTAPGFELAPLRHPGEQHAGGLEQVAPEHSIAAFGDPQRQRRIVVGLTGQLALVWPAYWGGRITGNAAMTPVVSVEVAAIAVLVFVVVLLLAQACTLIQRSDSSAPHDRPLIRTGEPNRRNQSRP